MLRELRGGAGGGEPFDAARAGDEDRRRSARRAASSSAMLIHAAARRDDRRGGRAGRVRVPGDPRPRGDAAADRPGAGTMIRCSRTPCERRLPPAGAAKRTIVKLRTIHERIPTSAAWATPSSTSSSKCPTRSSPRSASSAAPCGWSSRPSSRRCSSASTTASRGWSAAARSPTRSSPSRSSAAQAAFLGCVGDDRYGLFYKTEFEELGIDIGNPVIVGETTGTCVCVITPDAERTMRTCLAVSSHLAARHVDEERIKKSEWLFIEGYVFANPETGQAAIREAVAPGEAARRQGRRHLLGGVRRQASSATPSSRRWSQADLLFCNASEALRRDRSGRRRGGVRQAQGRGAVGGGDGRPARRVRPPRRRRGPRAGVPVRAEGPDRGRRHVRRGVPVRHHARRRRRTEAARAACFLAMKVITQVGARLHHGTRQFWDEADSTAAVSRQPAREVSLMATPAHLHRRRSGQGAPRPARRLAGERLPAAGAEVKWVERGEPARHAAVPRRGGRPRRCRRCAGRWRDVLRRPRRRFALSVAGGRLLPEPARPRVVWAGVGEGGRGAGRPARRAGSRRCWNWAATAARSGSSRRTSRWAASRATATPSAGAGAGETGEVARRRHRGARGAGPQQRVAARRAGVQRPEPRPPRPHAPIRA